MEQLTERQKFILTLVIHDYIRTAAAVASDKLVDTYRLEFSSATVRNELAVLTEMGYLRQVIKNRGGRVPTEEGYRYFVGRLLQETELPDTTRRTISHQFFQMRQDVEQWMHLAASILAHQSRAASLVTSPHPDQSHLKHLELISTRGRQVLMVMVMAGGEIHQRLISLTELVSQEQLSVYAEHLTNLLQGKSAEVIQAMRTQATGLEQDVLDWVATVMREADADVAGEVYMDGLTNLFAEPEFSDSEDARRTLRLLEERSSIRDLLARTVMTANLGGIQVLIGGEGTWDELRSCSVVLARYGAPGLATGTLGVIGPMRMAYGRTISTVRFMANLLSDLVTDTLGD